MEFENDLRKKLTQSEFNKEKESNTIIEEIKLKYEK